MNAFLLLAPALAWLAILAGSWLGWQLLRQNGRLLLRIEELEQRLNELEFGEPDSHQSEEALSPTNAKSEVRSPKWIRASMRRLLPMETTAPLASATAHSRAARSNATV